MRAILCTLVCAFFFMSSIPAAQPKEDPKPVVPKIEIPDKQKPSEIVIILPPAQAGGQEVRVPARLVSWEFEGWKGFKFPVVLEGGLPFGNDVTRSIIRSDVNKVLEGKGIGRYLKLTGDGGPRYVVTGDDVGVQALLVAGNPGQPGVATHLFLRLNLPENRGFQTVSLKGTGTVVRGNGKQDYLLTDDGEITNKLDEDHLVELVIPLAGATGVKGGLKLKLQP